MRLAKIGILNSVRSAQARNISFASVTDTTMTISWQNGTSAKRLVLMKAATPVNSNPANNTTYTASATFGSGTQIGTGNYTVFNSTGSSVTVTGLTANTLYYVRVYEYSGGAGAETYITTEALKNPNSNYSFTTEYKAVLDRGTTLGYTLPSDYGQKIQNDLLRGLKADSIWGELDVFYNLLSVGGSKEFATLNWVSPSTHQITMINTPTWTGTTGFTGNGTNSYLNMNYIPSSAGVKFTLNNAGFGGYVVSGSGSLISHLIPSTAARNAILVPSGTGNATLNLNGNTAKTGAANSGIGWWHGYRSASNAANLYKDAVSIISGNEASSVVPTNTMYALARNNNGTADSFAAMSVGCLWAGSKLDTSIALFFVEWDIYNYSVNNPTVNNTYQQFGTLLNDSFARASLGQNYAIQGSTATWTCDGSKLTTTLGTGVLQRLNWLYGNSFEKCTVSATVKLITTPSASTAGLSVGFSDFASPDVERTVFGQINCTNTANGGKASVHSYDGTTDTTQVTAASALGTPALNDVYQLDLVKSIVGGFNKYDLTVTRTVGGAGSTNAAWTTTSEAQGNSTGYFALFAHGGSFEITNMTVTVQDYQGIDDLFIGDSITHGYDGTDLTTRWASLVGASQAPRTFEVSAGNGDMTHNVLRKLASIRDYGASRVFLMIGGNDAAGGVSSTVYQPQYTAIRNFLKGTGATVVHCLSTPRDAFDNTGLNTFISGFTDDIVIDTFTPLKGSGTDLGATWDSGDGVHPNQTGMNLISTTVQAGI